MRKIAVPLAVLFFGASVAHGQILPTEPVSLAEGRVVVGAEVTATVAEEDPGFFNYTDYEYSALRNFRIGIAAQIRASRHVQVLGELRVDHGDLLQPFALYVRVRPWPERRFDIQAGRIPPTFGAFGRGSYGTENMLIGMPLAYQYLTSLRPDALPATTDDLLRMRGRGWLASYPVGDPSAERGLPLVNTVRWDTGVQLHGVVGIVEWTGAVTTGSLSNPRVRDDNGGRQFAGRVVARPLASLALGVSAARGAYLSDELTRVLPAGRDVDDGVQRAFGADIEYSRGRFLSRAEVIHSRWTLPIALTGTADEQLDATSLLAEARYRVWPGVQIAARAERLGFSDLATGPSAQSWDAPVRRIEIGGSYSVTRNVIVKVAWQRNTRDGGRIRRDGLGALQVVYWF